MKAKRWLTGALAAAMLLSMAAPVFATEVDADGGKTTVTGTTSVPDLKVEVPTSAGFTLNPYKMEVEIKPESSAGAGDAVTGNDAVISAPVYIENKSGVDVAVYASVVGTEAGDAKLMSKTAVAAKDKSVFLEYQALTVASKDTDPAATAWAKPTYKAAVPTTAATDPVKVADLGKAGGTKNKFLAFRLSGDAATSPTTAWDGNETVTVTIAYTFAPTVMK